MMTSLAPVPTLPTDAPPTPNGGFLRSYGPALVERGYSIVPIKPGTKAPMITGWQKRDFNREDLSRVFHGYGLGVKTGVLNTDGHAVVGLDIDSSDPAIVELMEAWCGEHLGIAPVRIGRAPRAMLILRTEKPFRKKRSPSFRSPDGVYHGVEVLGMGQQFVAYAIHPSTGGPYIWPKGELTDTPVRALAEISEAQAEAFVAHFQAHVPSDWRHLIVDSSGKRIGLGEDNGHRTSASPCAPSWKLRLALEVIEIPPDDPRDLWIKIGMALYHATEGSHEGMALWDGWSSKGQKYEPGEPVRLWKGFVRDPKDGAHYSAATIFDLADESDRIWRDRAREQERVEQASLMQEAARKVASLGEVTFAEPADKYEDDGQDAPGGVAALEPISLASLYGNPAPPQPWIVDGLIPDRTVTDLSGDGGLGKSLLALQLGVAMATGVRWIGREVAAGDVLYLSCEDELSTIQRRAEAIVATEGRTLAELPGLRVLDLTTGTDTELAVADRDGRLKLTELFFRLRDLVADHRPKLVVLDTRADVFAGNEIDRAQVRRFIRELRQLCQSYDMAILMLSHPSRAGMAMGDGQSGSTAWGNSVRSRLNLTREGDDPDHRVLKSLKANYGPAATEVTLRFDNGAFRFIGDLVEGKPLDREAQERRVEDRFMQHLADAELRGEYVNDAPTGPHYAPKVFASLDASAPDRIGKKHYETAMWRLRKTGRIKLEQHGSPSKGWRKFVAIDLHAPLKALAEWHGAT